MKKFKKNLSCLLVLIMLISLFPTKVFAEKIYKEDYNKKIGEEQGNDVKAKKLKPEGKIVKELTEKRDSNTKYFLRDDMTYEAVVYPEPVHYLDNGQWKDINNSLQDAADDSDTKTLTDGSIYGSGTEEEGTKSAFENTSNDFKVKIAKNAKSNKVVSVKKGDYELSWNLPGANDVKVQKINIDQNSIDESIEKAVDEDMSKDDDLKNATAEEKAEIKKTKIENEKIKTLTNISSKVEFADVYQNVDLQYETQGDKVKENIVINDKINNPIFKFNLNVKNLKAKIDKNNVITFYDKKDESKVVYIINAPTMYDAKFQNCNKIKVQLVETKKGYELTLIPDIDWLDSPDRSFPIVLDPPIQTSLEVSKIHDTYVGRNDAENKSLDSYLRVGNTPESGLSRTYMKFDLPKLGNGDMITAAVLRLAYYPSYSSGSGQINVHRIRQDYVPNTLTWGTQPAYDYDVIQDYSIVNSSDPNYYGEWDISKIAKEWYTSGNNFGLVLEQDNGGGYNTFIASDIPDYASNYRPEVDFYYVNNSGLESYWTYHSQDVGRAGTGYINDFNGNLVFVHEDLNMNGSRMPVSIKHVFNSNDVSNDFGCGKGWRLNLSQKITPRTFYNEQWYEYIDEDGTKIYFKLDAASNTYKDLSGNNLTLTKDPSGVYIITDKKDNKLVFTSAGYLYSITDSNKNQIIISYSGQKISTVRDGANRIIKFEYTSGGYLTAIYDPSGRKTSFSYGGTNLTTITDPDQQSSIYQYDGNNNLQFVRNFDMEQVNYSYFNGSPYKVQKVSESSVKDSSKGGELTIGYGYNLTSFTDVKGRKDIYEFNNTGNTICVRGDNGEAKYYKYDDIQNINKLTLESKLQRTINNYLKNHNVEANDSSWSQQNWTGSEGTFAIADSVKYPGEQYLGNKSLMVNKSNDDSRSLYTQRVNLTKGNTYTLSAYVKTDNITSTNGGASIFVDYHDNAGQQHTVDSKFITGTNDWQRSEVSFTIPNDASDGIVDVSVGITEGQGTAYFDCMQLEDGPIANNYNLIENPDFTYGSGVPSYWYKNSDCDSSDCLYGYSGDCIHPQYMDSKVFQFNGLANKQKGLYQDINISGKKGDVFSFSSWAKGDSVPLDSNKYFAIDLGLQKLDGKYDWYYLNFNQDSSEWQYLSDRAIALEDYKSARFCLLYYDNANKVYFDGVNLSKEEFGTSYQYDDKGNIVSTEAYAAQNSKFQYNSKNDLITETDPKGNKFTYTYDDNHNVETATTAQNVVYSFEYDSNGNPKKSTVGDEDLEYISTDATYTGNGNYLKTLTDSSGNTTVNNWDENKGLLNTVVDANGNTTFNTYDDMDRLQSVSVNLGGNALETFPLNSSTTGSNGTKAVDENTIFEKDANSKSYFASYEGTTNLFSTNSSFDNGLTGWTFNDWDSSTGKWRAVTDGVNGSGAIEFYDSDGFTNGSGTNVVGYQTITLPSALTSAANYTISGYAKISGASQPTLGIYCYNANGQPVANGYQNYVKTINVGQWTKISQTFSVPAGTKQFLAIIRTGVKDKETVRFDAMQLEAKAYDSPYTSGSSSASKLIYNLGINKSSGTMSLKFYTKGTGVRQILSNENLYGSIFNVYVDADNTVKVDLTNTFGRSIYGKTNLITTGGAISPNSWHSLALSWGLNSGSFNCVLYLDNNKYNKVDLNSGTVITAIHLSDFSSGKTAVGSSVNGQNQLDGDIEQFNYSPHVLSETDIKSLWNGTLTNSAKSTVSSSYTYANDRIQTVTHNGFTYSFGYDSLGNNTAVDVGNLNLITNNYETTTGKLLDSTYGNKQVVSNVYDDWDRIVGKSYNGSVLFNYQFDGSGNLGYLEDKVNLVNYRYIYDEANRLAKIQDSNGNSILYEHDNNNCISKIIDKINNNNYTTTYVYDSDNRPQEVDINNGSKEIVAYDPLARVQEKKYNTGADIFTTTYSYLQGLNMSDTTRVDYISNNGKAIYYSYDNNGNITSIKENAKTITYSYDELDELIREDNQVLNKTIIYSYDAGGNISSKSEYPFSLGNAISNDVKPINKINYTYGDTNWKDLLTYYNGNIITYDSIGNPIKYNGYTYTWEWGRQLAAISGNGKNISYKYNDEGIRTQKNVNGVITNYHLVGDKVTYEDNGTDKIYYSYDASGDIVSMNLNGIEYYYIRNAQGDIIGLFDSTGQQVVSYSYDSWGNPAITSDEKNDVNDKVKDGITGPLASTVGVKNPYRYRAYRYDSEIGFYYLQSRYYSPEFGRFINADGLVGQPGELLSHNMFAYCCNNPINREDSDGHCWKDVFAAIGKFIKYIVDSAKANKVNHYGAAEPYRKVKGGGNSPNCYGYALNINIYEDPGYKCGINPKGNNVISVAYSVINDLHDLGRSGRIIDGVDGKVENNEYRIALRVGTKPFTYDNYRNPMYDYHFMVQTADGTWAEKHGPDGDSILHSKGQTPDNLQWDSTGYYNSTIVYLAITR